MICAPGHASKPAENMSYSSKTGGNVVVLTLQFETSLHSAGGPPNCKRAGQELQPLGERAGPISRHDPAACKPAVTGNKRAHNYGNQAEAGESSISTGKAAGHHGHEIGVVIVFHLIHALAAAFHAGAEKPLHH